MDVNYMISTLLFALLMGVGTITRSSSSPATGGKDEGSEPRAGRAHRTDLGGESVATSASTVIIAFLAMATADFSFVHSLGIIIAIAIIIALLVALTLIPSILMLVGNRIFWPTTGKRWETYREKFMAKKAAATTATSTRRQLLGEARQGRLIVAVLVTVPSTYMFVTADTSFDFIGAMGDSESIDGIKAMTDDFGAGSIQPTQIVITGGVDVYNETGFNYAYLDAIDNLTAAVASQSEVQKVTGITRPYGNRSTIGTWVPFPMRKGARSCRPCSPPWAMTTAACCDRGPIRTAAERRLGRLHQRPARRPGRHQGS
jgi:RND superfamily putative drug exporter